MLRFILHYGIHFLLPVLLVVLFVKENRWQVLFILWSGIFIDLDHLLATPVFDPDRCSIGFHPLHSYLAIAVYFLLLLPKRTRWVGLALVIHIFADAVDCSMIGL